MVMPAPVCEPSPAGAAARPMRLSVLGATGSIGGSTLDLVARNPARYEVVALTAQCNAPKLAQLAIAHKAKLAVLSDPAGLGELRSLLSGSGVRAGAGPAALIEAAEMPADCVMAAIVGAAGLEPTFAAARQGCRVALANKECLVSAGAVFLEEVARSGAELLPVDSEHSAAFQALGQSAPECIDRIILTASGGPFRTWTAAAIEAATPEAALKHPNWSMGSKITIDSATMMNKGLELIEAYHLFPVEADQLSVLVHPQSIVHCLVAYRDGSVMAQLAPPDMRAPISLALAWPQRMATPVERLDLARIQTLSFEAPDEMRFPALRIARAAMERGGAAPAVMNAANEVAVAAFLGKRLGFGGIARAVERTLEAAEVRGLVRAPGSLQDVLGADQSARALAAELLGA